MKSAYFPNGVDAEIYLRIKYETQFGIYDHFAPTDPNVPWPLMAVSPKESMTAPGFMKLRLDQYAEFQINTLFGLTFDEFIDRPRREVLEILEVAREILAKQAAQGSGANARMNELENRVNSAHKAAQAATNRSGNRGNQQGRK